jgi:RimJ/RimL family protein N-acetyltransferase
MRRARSRRSSLTLVSIYRLPKRAPQLLYTLLQERESRANISHRAMPSWKQHREFIARRPYSAWYLIKLHKDYVGAIYLTSMNEIGIAVLKQWRKRGVAPAAADLLMRKHGRRRYLANINPRNEESIRLFRRLGFRIVQHTYELPT